MSGQKGTFEIDPYEPPSAAAQGIARASDDDEVPDDVVEHLRASRTWIWVAAGLGVTVGVLFGIAVLATAASKGAHISAVVIFAVLSAGHLAPSIVLLQLASAIQAVLDTRSNMALSKWAATHRSFWRTVAIAVLILVAVVGAWVFWLVSQGPWD